MLDNWKTLESGLFFILGTGRCGTTLLQSMLSEHSKILVPLELGFFTNWEPAIHFSDPLLENEVEDYLRSCIQYWWWPALSINSEAFSQVVRGGVRSARSIFLWLLWQLSARSGKVKIGEKTIGNWEKVGRILKLFPQAKFIHIYRDPRDVVVSLKNQDWWIRVNEKRCGRVNEKDCGKNYSSIAIALSGSKMCISTNNQGL